jgi:hypothetical protein
MRLAEIENGMMMSCTSSCKHGVIGHCTSCDRRDRFAAAALQGLLAGPRSNVSSFYADHAMEAAKFADALIAELDKP